MKMLDEIKTADRAEKWMMDALANKAKIMGFGHRVYKSGDSRVPIMREIGARSRERVGKEQWIPICEKLEATMEREKHLCANVDLYAAPVFTMLGVPSGVEHADLRRLARRRLVRACGRATRSQSAHPPALALHRPGGAALQGMASNGVAVEWSMAQCPMRRTANARPIASGKICAEQRLLGLRTGESRRSCASAVFPRRRGRGGMETGAKIRSFSRSPERRNHRHAARLPLQLDRGLHLMKQAGEDHPPCTVTADYAIKLLRPTPTNGPVLLSAKVVESTANRATIEGTLSGGGKFARPAVGHSSR